MAERRERLLMQRYIEERYPRAHVRIEAQLGYVPEDITVMYGPVKALKVARAARPTIDAIVFEEKRLLFVEAKIARWLDGMSKLPFYKAIAPITPELADYRDWPITMRLVIPYVQDHLLKYAELMGIEVDEFTTPEVTAYVQDELPKYQTAEYKRNRAARREALERLGLE